jgi:hypothetical protein
MKQRLYLLNLTTCKFLPLNCQPVPFGCMVANGTWWEVIAQIIRSLRKSSKDDNCEELTHCSRYTASNGGGSRPCNASSTLLSSFASMTGSHSISHRYASFLTGTWLPLVILPFFPLEHFDQLSRLNLTALLSERKILQPLFLFHPNVSISNQQCGKLTTK